jgi:hypothetical protein
MRAVFLVGVNHQYQVGPDGDPPVEASAEDFSKFEDFLRDVIARHGIRGIAEEMSRYALRTRQRVRGDSFPCHLAAKIGRPHRYCDPDAATQKAFTMNSQRQEYWIKELISFDTFPVLFILGAGEVESFEGLLIEAAFQPFIVERNWQPDKPE